MPSLIEEISNLKQSFLQGELQDGDIIIVEKVHSEQE